MKAFNSIGILFITLMVPWVANAYESGSTGADGAFNPPAVTGNLFVPLPPNGIFNFTDINIPAGVNVIFTRNANNTPLYILASGDVTIDGNMNVNGANGRPYNGGSTAGAGGNGGPGGFSGGQGGLYSSLYGGDGQGPGRGTGGPRAGYGGGGSFGGLGGNGTVSGTQGRRGSTYGQATLRTLIGGSGGGGAAGDSRFLGGGGGGGGGAILIAASGAITVNGIITARGGVRGFSPSNLLAGGGSGGAIRLVATTLQGEGTIIASGTGGGVSNGGDGRIRLEAENFLRTSSTTPAYSGALPFPALYASVPTLRITSIGGGVVPGNPSGFRDVVLAGVTTNPVTVGFETTNIPLGSTIALSAAPQRGTAALATSTGVTGSIALGIASVSINLPNGNSTLFGQTSFTITLAANLDLLKYSKYAQGEKVEKMRFDIDSDGQSETTFITVSGKEYTFPSNAVAMN